MFPIPFSQPKITFRIFGRLVADTAALVLFMGVRPSWFYRARLAVPVSFLDIEPTSWLAVRADRFDIQVSVRFKAEAFPFKTADIFHAGDA